MGESKSLKFNLNLIKEIMYGREKGNNPAFYYSDAGGHSYKDIGVFTTKNNDWKDVVDGSYDINLEFMNSITKSSFLYLHFGGVTPVINYIEINGQECDENKSYKIRGKFFSGEKVTSYKTKYHFERVNNELLNGYSTENGVTEYGASLQAIMDVNLYIISNYCMISNNEFYDKLIYIRKAIESDEDFMMSDEDHRKAKSNYTRKIDAYLNQYVNLCSFKSNDSIEDEKVQNLAITFSWMLIGALLKPIFFELANINDKDIETIREVYSNKETKEIVGLRDCFEDSIYKSASFRLVKQPNKLLFPYGFFVDENGEKHELALDAFIRSIWEGKGFKNLIISGEGGIGKTMSSCYFAASLEFNKNIIPALYIPLNQLGGETEINGKCVSKDIDWFISTSYTSYEKLIHNLATRSTGIGPNTIMVLDGYNEVDPSLRNDIDNSIIYWSKKCGVQLIITTRSAPSFLSGFTVFNVLPLRKERVIEYLNANNNDIDVNDVALIKILSNPLFLQLYIQSKDVRERIDDNIKRILSWRDKIDSPFDIIWNYLQIEIYNCIERNLKLEVTGREYVKYKAYKSDYAYAILLLCPYISFRLVSESRFSFSLDDLEGWICDGIKYIDKILETSDITIMKQIRNISFKESTDSLNRDNSELVSLYLNIIIKMNIMVSSNNSIDEDEYCLMHQCIRDYLCSLSLYEYLYESSNMQMDIVLPKSILDIGENSVIKCLSDIMSEKEIKMLWENVKTHDFSNDQMKNKPSASSGGLISIQTILAEDINCSGRNSIYWLLNLYGHKHKFNFANLDFSKANLINVNLTTCKKQNSLVLTLPTNGNRFDKAKISDYTFKTLGHLGKINALSVIPELGIAISGDSFGVLNLWDLKKNKLVCPLKKHKSDIREIDVNEYNDGYHIVCCSYDGSIDIYYLDKNTFSIDNLDELIPEKEYKSPCENPLTVVKEIIDEDYHFLVAGDVAGNIIAWDLNQDSVHIMKKHTKRINCLSFVMMEKSWKCLSGAEDYKVCLWSLKDLKSEKTPVAVLNNVVKRDRTDVLGSHFYIETSQEKSKSMWDNHKIGITDIQIYNYKNKLYTVYSDSYGRLHKYDLYNYGCERSRVIGDNKKSINKIGLYNGSDGKVLGITCSDDGSVSFWDMVDEKLVGEPIYAHTDWVTGIDVLDNDRAISYGHDKKVVYWDLNSKCAISETSPMNDWIICAANYKYYNDNSCIIGDACGNIQIWNVSYNYLIGEFKGYPSEVLDIRLFIQDDNKYIAIASTDGTVRIYDIKGKKIISILEGHEGWVNYVYVNDIGDKIYSCGSDGTVIIHDIRDIYNPKFVLRLLGHSSWVLGFDCLKEDKNNLFVSCSYDHSLIVWQKGDGDILLKNKILYENSNLKSLDEADNDIGVFHEAGVKLCKNLNNHTVISGGYDGKVILWSDIVDNPMGRLLYKHEDWVRDILIYNQGKNVISAGVDGKTVFYDLVSNTKMIYHTDRGYFNQIKMFNDITLIALSSDNTICILDISDLDDIKCVDKYVAQNNEEIVSFEIADDKCIIATKEGMIRFIGIVQNLFQTYFEDSYKYLDFRLMQGTSVIGTNLSKADFGSYDGEKKYLEINGAIV